MLAEEGEQNSILDECINFKLDRVPESNRCMLGLRCLTEELAVWRRKCIILESASEVQARAM